MILVDTSVWVSHLRQDNRDLAELLYAGDVACHPFVIGELACGSIHDREACLALLSALPSLPKIADTEVLEFISRHRLMGKGLGLIDMHLLASCMLHGVGVWTHDKGLARAAARLGCGGDPRAAHGG